MKDPNGEEVTLGKVSFEALMAPHQDQTKFDKTKCYTLAIKIAANPSESEIDVSAQDISLIKDAIKDSWNTAVTGCAWDLLEACSSIKEKEFSKKK